MMIFANAPLRPFSGLFAGLFITLSLTSLPLSYAAENSVNSSEVKQHEKEKEGIASLRPWEQKPGAYDQRPITNPAGFVIEPLSIEDAVQFTLNNNHAFKMAQDQYLAAKYDKRVAEGGFGPTVTFESIAEKSYTRGNTQNADGTYTSFDGTLQETGIDSSLILAFSVWDGLGTQSLVDSAEARVNSQKYGLFATNTSLAFSTINAMIQIRLSEKLIELTKEAIVRYEELIALSGNRVAMGLDDIADISKAKSRLAQSRITLIDQEAALETAKNTLVRLTQLPKDVQIAPISSAEIRYRSTEEVMRKALEKNPSLAQAYTNVDIFTGNANYAKSTFSPQVDFQLIGNYNSEHEGTGSHTKQAQAYGTVNWNVFNSGADWANMKSNLASADEYREAFANAIDTMRLDVETQFTNLKAAKEQEKYWKESTEYNKKTLRLYIDQFTAGERTLLDVLDAERELYDSETEIVNNQSAAILVSYRLLSYSGELLANLGMSQYDILLTTESLREDEHKYNEQ